MAAAHKKVMSKQNPIRKSTTGETGNKGEFGNATHNESSVALVPATEGVSADQANERYYGAQPDTIERFTRSSQGYSFERVLSLPATDRVPDQTLRAILVRDYYPNQSSSVVALWTSNGWVEVDRIPGDFFSEQLPSVAEKDDEFCRSEANAVLIKQILGALRIIG